MMKRFTVSVLAITVFFVGLGSLAEGVGAKFKSDEKALDIIRRARIAIGGESAVAGVRSMVITGRTNYQIKTDGAERTEQGETEIAMMLPDKLMKKISIGKNDGTGERKINAQHDVLVMTKDGSARVELREGSNGEFTSSDGRTIVVKERVPGDAFPAGDGEKRIFVRKIEQAGSSTFELKGGEANVEGKNVTLAPKAHSRPRHNELLRHTLALLLTAPEGMDVSYSFAGESEIDGVAVNIVNAEFGGLNYKLFIGRSNDLPVAMSYVGMPAPQIFKFRKNATPESGETVAPSGTVTFTRKIDAHEASVEHMVRFSDYRPAGNVLLPYKWTTSVGGAVKDSFEVTSYDINPANIAERFQNQRVFVRAKTADGQ